MRQDKIDKLLDGLLGKENIPPITYREGITTFISADNPPNPNVWGGGLMSIPSRDLTPLELKKKRWKERINYLFGYWDRLIHIWDYLKGDYEEW